MNNDLNLKLLESDRKVNKVQDKVNNEMFNFITRAMELIELSKDEYQIERTLRLNKISLKGFILDSSCCISLKANNIRNYSIQELKSYLQQYENKNNEDYSKYYLAVSLYELVENIEKSIDTIVSLEFDFLIKIIPSINIIKDVDRTKYEEIYLNLKNQLSEYLNNSILNENSYKICVKFLNNIFNFYINGYPIIPDEYLYKNNVS